VTLLLEKTHLCTNKLKSCAVEKLLFVLEGTAVVKLDQKEYTLEPHDTIYFDASIPHQLANPASKQAKIFCAVSPSKI